MSNPPVLRAQSSDTYFPTPRKTHFTGLCDSAQEAAVARANLKKDLDAGIDAASDRKPRAKRGSLVGARLTSASSDVL